MVVAWHAALARAIHQAIDEGHLAAATDATQMLFELHGLILALHHDARFLRLPGAVERATRAFDHVLTHYVRPLAVAPNHSVPRRQPARKR
jgi:hypothetical protein